MMKELLEYDKTGLIGTLWKCDPDIYSILKSSDDLQDARNNMFHYLNGIERHLFNIYSDKHFKDINILERNNAKECIRVFKNIIRTENEEISNFSAFNVLYKIAKKKIDSDKFTAGFVIEFIFLFKGINCTSGLYSEKDFPLFLRLSGFEVALERTKSLDNYAANMENVFKRYKTD